MRIHRTTISRRQLLGQMAFGAAVFTTPGLFAEELVRTPTITEGPFYPDKLPLDTDNDLLVINDGITPAVGTITHLSGRVLDARGEPIRGALVKIWQVDNNGCYIHSRSPNQDRRDTHFQGFGKFLTGSTGEYYFRTIKPVPYADRTVRRTPHIHVAIELKGRQRFTTQFFIKGYPQNQEDAIFRAVTDPKARATVEHDFTPMEGSRIGEVAAAFDIVMGLTPEM
jgi:protocatechuate 3,4-dioxygenase beta subunit